MIVRKGPVFLLGDVNFDVGCSSKPGVVSYLRMLIALNLHQLIDKPTRLGTSGSGTVIDHVIANTAGLEQYASVIPVPISDHDLVMLDAPLPRDRRPPRAVTVRSLRDVDYDRLRLDLFWANWEPVYRAACADTKYDAFLTVWNGYIDQHCTLKTVRFRHQGCPIGLPDFGKSFKSIVEPGFPHEFDHAEFNGAQKNQIQKYLGVAILN